MKTVRVTMPDEAFSKLNEQAKEAGLPGIASLLLKKANVLTDDAEAADVKKQAFTRARKLEIGERFKLRGLFTKDKWEMFPKAVRIRAGRQFFAEVQEGVSGVRAEKKSSSNHQFYVRTRDN